MLNNQKFGKRLVQAGVISQTQLEEALRQQQVQEGRLGELLVQLGFVSEATVLQFLAAEFRTRYVSTERLAKARIPRQVLELLPLNVAEHYHLIPVLYDPDNSTLSIVTSDPQNEASLREVHMITRVRELRVYVALQSAVQAAIRKHYRNEQNAFEALLQKDQVNYNATHGAEYGQTRGAYVNANYGYTYENTGDNTNVSSVPGYGQGNTAYATFDQYNNTSNRDYNADYVDDDVTRIHSNFHETLYSDSDVYHEQTSQSRESLLLQTSLQWMRLFSERLRQSNEAYASHMARQEPLFRLVLKRLNLDPVSSDDIELAFYVHQIFCDEYPRPDLMSLEKNDERQVETQEQYLEELSRFKMIPLPTNTFHILQ
ncbi:MAG: hypothetical protein AAGJ35_06705, partial [Myxococcota bacterium]